MSYWIFQGNPEKSDILSFLQKGDYWIKKNGYWAAKQKKELMEIGDIAYFWKSGNKGGQAGIYGTTHLVSKYKYIPNQKFGDYYVKLQIDKYLGEKYISRYQCKENSILSNSNFMKFNQWTNYLLTVEEVEEIKKLLASKITNSNNTL